MPIKKEEGMAKLWFKTKQQEQAYDDKMIASIQLKSQEFNDQNFSPIFTRSKTQHFFSPTQQLGQQLQSVRQVNKIVNKISPKSTDQWVKQSYGQKPNHSYYRTWPIEKFIMGLFGSYFIIRQVIVNNADTYQEFLRKMLYYDFMVCKIL